MPRPYTNQPREYLEGITVRQLIGQLKRVDPDAKVLAQDTSTGLTYRVISTIGEEETWDPRLGKRLTRSGVFLRIREEKDADGGRT